MLGTTYQLDQLEEEEEVNEEKETDLEEEEENQLTAFFWLCKSAVHFGVRF